jgi:hypothetical protein
MAIRTAMTEITTNSSMSVNAEEKTVLEVCIFDALPFICIPFWTDIAKMSLFLRIQKHMEGEGRQMEMKEGRL